MLRVQIIFGLLFIIGVPELCAQVPSTDSLSVDSLSTEVSVVDSVSKPHTTSVINSKINYEASDSIDNDIANFKVILYGNAMITYDGITLKAHRIVYDFKTYTVHADGYQDSLGNWLGLPVFDQNGTSFEAREMDYNFRSKKAYVKQVQTEIIDGTITGQRVKTMEDNRVIYISKAEYCPCEDPNAKTRIKINRLKMIKDEKIVSGPGYLKLGKIPTPLVFPFGFFPDSEKRQAGLIIPSYGNADELGFFLQDLGFYLPVNEYIDTKILVDLYSRGSYGIENVTRYKKLYKFDGVFDVEYNVLNQGDRDLNNFSSNRNFFVTWSHTQDRKARPYSNFSADVRAGSSQNYTNNLNASQDDFLTNTFRSNVRFDQRFPNSPWTLAANARHEQNSQTGIYTFVLPEFNANMARIFPLDGLFNDNPKQTFYEKIGFVYSTAFQNSLTVNEEDLALNNMSQLSKDFRNGFRHTAALSTSVKAGKVNINPSFSYNERWYFSEQGRVFDADAGNYVVDTIYGFNRNYDYNLSVEATTKIYGMYTFTGDKLKAIRHTMTPRVNYSYRPDFDPNVYGFYGTDGQLGSYSPFAGSVYGGPPKGRNELLTFTLVNNLEAKVLSRRDTTSRFAKIPILENLQLSSAYNFAADSMQLRPIAISGRTRVSKYANINFSSSFNPYSYGVTWDGKLYQQDVYLVQQSGKLMSFETGQLAINATGLSSELFKRKRAEEPTVIVEGDEFINAPLLPSEGGIFSDFSIPWNLTFGYVITANAGRKVEEIGDLFVITDSIRATNQSLQCNGDLQLFKIAFLRFNSGYDFILKEFTPTTFNVVIDLNCWEFSARIIPFGTRKSYNMSINIKSTVLKDLKLERNRNYGNGEGFF